MLHRTIIKLFAASLLFLSVMPAKAADGKLPADRQRRFQYFFLEAVNQQAAGNLSAAYDLFHHALEINPDAAEVYYNLAGFYVTLRNDSLAKQCFEKAAALAPENTTYAEKLGQLYINYKDYQNATKAYERLYAMRHDNPDVITMLLQLYGTQNDYDKMIEMLNRLETVQGSSDRISLTKMQVYEQQGNKKAQENELKSLMAKYPNDPNYRVMYCNWLMHNGRPKEAYKYLSQALKDDPTNVGARLSMLDYYSSLGKEDKIKELTLELLTSKDIPSQTKTALLRQTIIDNEQHNVDSTETLALIDKVLAQPQEDGDMYLMKAAYLSMKQMSTAAVDSAYEQALRIEPDNSRARLLLLQDIWQTEDYDSVIAVARPGQEYNPDDMAFYYFEGMGLYLKKDNDKALEVFRKGVSQINKDSDPDIVSDFYAIMGDILHEKGQDSLAFDSYDKCLQWKSDNYGALNNYAYYLSELDRDLEKAERMSKKTIDAQPDNSTFLDTYAWILFMEGKYADAKVSIERAIANDSTLGDVVLEHAGDIYSKNGDDAKALEYWQKAATKGEGSATLRRKIETGKYIDK